MGARPTLTAAVFFLAPTLLLGAGALPSTELEVRRVAISITFSGQRIFMHGQAPEGAERALTIVEGPSPGPVRLMEKGRKAFFWLGVRQYLLSGAPGFYVAQLSCPLCNGVAECSHPADIDSWNTALAGVGVAVGPSAIMAKGHLECVSGELEPGEADRTLSGYWKLQQQRGLYDVRGNAIRIADDGSFYEVFRLPPQAPEGKYSVLTYFLEGDRLVGETAEELFVRKAGLIASLSRLGEHRALLYSLLTVGTAIAAGWLAGIVFKRGSGH